MAEGRWSAWFQAGAVLLLAAAASILAQGLALPSGINAYHWPVLFDWIGSAEGPDDPFIASLVHFVTFFWPALGLVVDETNAPWLLPLVHLGLRFLLCFALYLIFSRLQPNRQGALLLAAVLPIGAAFFIESPLGHGEVLLDNLSHSSANPPLALFIFYCAMSGRWILAGLLLGLLFNVNAFVAAWLGLAVGLSFCLAERDRPRAAALRQGLPALLLALALALPTALRIARTLADTAPQLPAYDFRDFLREFYGGHFFSEETAAGGWLLFALLLAGLAWLGVTLRPLLLQRSLDAWRGLALGLLAVVLFGIALPSLSGSRLLLNAHPLRMDFLLVWLFYAGMGLWSLGHGRLDWLVLAAWIALFAGCWAALAVLLPLASRATNERPYAFVLWLLVLATSFALLDSLPNALFGPPRPVRAAELVLLLPALAFACGSLQARPWAPLLGLLAALPLAPMLPAWWISVALLLPLPWLLHSSPGTARLLPVTAMVLALAAAWQARTEPPVAGLILLGALLPLAAGGLLRWRPATLSLERRLVALCFVAAAAVAMLPGARHLAATGRIDRYDESALAFLEVQRWAREATPAGSVFLVPESQLRPNLVPSFWTESRRSAWVDWRMGAGAHWLPDFYWLWHQRMLEVAALGDPAAKLAYAREKEIRYIVLDATEPLPGGAPLAYSNAHYRVVDALP